MFESNALNNSVLLIVDIKYCHSCVLITVEVINFFGSNSEYIMSGSNCGDIFIYDKDTGAGVQQLPLYDSNHTFFSKRVEFFYFVHLINNFFL